ncbi:MAG: aminopeptidase P family protein [Ignavibacteriae bacterium]|nr:aminopeptidase P family protein [Ignavibacteriota bacterium]
MRKHGLDALIVSSISNIRYLTGFTGSNGLLIIASRSALFFSDIRFLEQAKLEVRNCRVHITKFGLYEEASRRKALHGASRVGFESQQITYAQYRVLRRLFPSTSFASTKEIVEDVMLVKDEAEIALMRKAAEISDQVFGEVVKIIRPGISELEIAGTISYLHRKLGAERDAFEIIVASGERSAFPHARATQKKIKSGELVTLDFGCVVGGYNSDITRTVAVGKASLRAKRMYDVVHDAQQTAIESARGGMWAKDLDAVARQRIEKRGMGKFFNHSLGHGLGLHIHERPRVSELSKERLRAGSVITIEPGVYVPGFGGVRIEDDVLLTENGCVVLNTAPKEFLIL